MAPLATEFGRITQNSGHKSRSRSFKITDFSTSRKPIMRLPISNYYQLTSYHAPFSFYCRLLIKFSLSTGGGAPVFNTLVRGEPLNPERIWRTSSSESAFTTDNIIGLFCVYVIASRFHPHRYAITVHEFIQNCTLCRAAHTEKPCHRLSVRIKSQIYRTRAVPKHLE